MRCDFYVYRRRGGSVVFRCRKCKRVTARFPLHIHDVVRKCTVERIPVLLGDKIAYALKSIGITPERFAYIFGCLKLSWFAIEYVPVTQRSCGCKHRQEVINTLDWKFRRWLNRKHK